MVESQALTAGRLTAVRLTAGQARRGWALAGAALAIGGVAAPVSLAQDSPLGLLTQTDQRATAAPQVYSTPDGRVRFVFDRTPRGYALLQVLGDDEIHALYPIGGLGGDEIYATENRSLVVRVRPGGALTLYTGVYRDGAPVARDGSADPLAPQPLPPAVVQQRLAALQASARRQMGRQIPVSLPPVQGPEAHLALDALARAAQALAQTPQAQVQQIVIRFNYHPQARAEARLQAGVLLLVVAPRMGFAGRPSSALVRMVISAP